MERGEGRHVRWKRGELCLKRCDFQADPHSDFNSEHGGIKMFYYLICHKSIFELRKLLFYNTRAARRLSCKLTNLEFQRNILDFLLLIFKMIIEDVEY